MNTTHTGGVDPPARVFSSGFTCAFDYFAWDEGNGSGKAQTTKYFLQVYRKCTNIQETMTQSLVHTKIRTSNQWHPEVCKLQAHT